ncbi:MAG TPA: hypothetical protein DC054_25525 [Blastocatellia bacterium]|nr:hypothetical protein [Blastocatellia bacterium]
MRVSVGDVATYGAAARSATPTIANLVKLCRSVYRPTNYDRLVGDRLEETYSKATVCCCVFQNMTPSTADALHAKLYTDPAYLGAMDVDFATPLHLGLFRNSLIERYRLQGLRCSMFYVMGDNEDPDLAEREIFERNGFEVDYEDIGARRTIFDTYDTAEHFRRAADFQRIFVGFDGFNEDWASDLSLSLEELHPKLFDAFASAARALERAETEEDLAQSALSGRRLLEALADYLFPPQSALWKGRKVGRAEYRNRLWAFIERTLSEVPGSDPSNLDRLGKELDRLVELFNSGLHGETSRTRVEAGFRDLVIWLAALIDLSPVATRLPYLAYEPELNSFFEKLAHNHLAGGAE